MARFRLAVVGVREPGFLRPLARCGVAAFDSVDAAVASVELGRRARVLAVADAMSTVVRVGSPLRANGQKAHTTSMEVGR